MPRRPGAKRRFGGPPRPAITDRAGRKEEAESARTYYRLQIRLLRAILC